MCRDSGSFKPVLLARLRRSLVAHPGEAGSRSRLERDLVRNLQHAKTEGETEGEAAAPVPDRVSKRSIRAIAKGPLQIIISIDQQKLHLYGDRSEVTEALVASGVPGHPDAGQRFQSFRKTVCTARTSITARRCPLCSASPGQVSRSTKAAISAIPLRTVACVCRTILRRGCGSSPGSVRGDRRGPEVRPTEFADPHLFVHREISPAVPTASQPVVEGRMETTTKPARGREEATHQRRARKPVKGRRCGPPAMPPSPPTSPTARRRWQSLRMEAARARCRPSISRIGRRPRANQAPALPTTADAPPAPPAVSPVALPAVPVPPVKPAENRAQRALDADLDLRQR